MINLSAAILAAILKCCSIVHILITICVFVSHDDDFVEKHQSNLFIEVRNHIL